MVKRYEADLYSSSIKVYEPRNLQLTDVNIGTHANRAAGYSKWKEVSITVCTGYKVKKGRGVTS